MPNSARSSRAPDGFTLLEILIVISIIAILMSLIIPGIQIAQTEARKAATIGQVTLLDAAVERFRDDEGYYPAGPESDDVNAFPALFEAVADEPRPAGRGGRGAPYLDVRGRDVFVNENDPRRVDDDFRQASPEERSDPGTPKFLLDSWRQPYWYQVKRTGVSRRPQPRIWSTGPDRENQTLLEDVEADDIRNF